MASLDEQVVELVRAGLAEALAPYLRRLVDPECATYSIPQTAKVLGTSAHTVRRLIDGGHLRLIPHMGERRVLSRAAVHAFIEGTS